MIRFKRWFIRIPLYIICILVVIIGGFALFIQLRGIPSYPVSSISLHIDYTPARVVRGRKLSNLLCAECHLNQKTGRLTGKELVDLPKAFGRAWSRNITHDSVNGIGAWTDGDIAFLLRTGIKKNGQYAPPWMVKLHNVSDEDLYSIIAYLRSDDSLVQALPVKDHESEPSWLAKFLCLVAFKPFDYPNQPIPTPDSNNKIAYGKYLVNDLMQCYACHSADFKTNDYLNPEHSVGYLGGGNPMPDAAGNIIATANLTMAVDGGIGTWTEEQFIRAVREDFGPDNRVLRYPMEPSPDLTPAECSDIFAYLKTVPMLHKQIDRSSSAKLAIDASDGDKIYHKYSCYSCHGETGAGVCDLRQGYIKYPTDSALTAWIKNPSRTVPDSKMPTWDGIIQENEYSALCAYVRELGQRASNMTAVQ